MTLSTLYDRTKTALETISAVKEVSTDIQRFTGANQFPVLYYEIDTTESEWITFYGEDVTDREATAEIKVYGTIKPRYKANIQSNTLTMISEVERVINSMVTGTDVVNVKLNSHRNDIDINNAFGYIEMIFEVVYLYKRQSP